jgi:D-alanyl-D-alanine carboxypeptidase
MSVVVVRYQTKPERAEENRALIDKVFDEFEQRQPEGFTYNVYQLEDGVSFVHVVIEHEDVTNSDSLSDIPAFQAFTAEIADRCEVQPVASAASAAWQYR